MADVSASLILARMQPASRRLREGFPKFIVLLLDEGDALVGCPMQEGRCGNQFVVHFETWVKSSDSLARPCPYCFMASGIPPREMIKTGGEGTEV